ncbi:LysR substrate-binding domain-containing protein [Antarcticirhabdus aurantiaca]|uniref:LysR substrate-binding domain-containing protein n=1 Tax=Antarcticirhabdus aurantiaca TaxID=2606717 RepID=UPI001AEEDB3D|nr:LysR substrate-binding domain-containing protein [Antarcticirhabdus aurantiaca]
MEMSWFEDLSALAKCLNSSRAAEMRNVTQLAFSRRVRAFEDWVGHPLVDRSSHRLELTAAGNVMLEVADEVMRSLEAGRRSAQASMEDRPTLRFASTHALSLTAFPRMLRALGPAATAVPVHLYADNMVACKRLMAEGLADFLLCHHHPMAPTRLDPGAYSWMVIGTNRLVPVCRREALGQPVFAVPGDPSDPTPLLAFDGNSGMGRIVEVSPHARIDGTRTNFTSHLAVALKAMAMDGMGVAWLPLSLVDEELGEGGSLCEVRGDYGIPVDVVLLRPARNLGQTAEALVECVGGQPVRRLTRGGQARPRRAHGTRPPPYRIPVPVRGVDHPRRPARPGARFR